MALHSPHTLNVHIKYKAKLLENTNTQHVCTLIKYLFKLNSEFYILALKCRNKGQVLDERVVSDIHFKCEWTGLTSTQWLIT